MLSFDGFAEQHVPDQPIDEIPRDLMLKKIFGQFGRGCQRQMVVGGPQSGKTNLLAEFVRQNPTRCICYFVTSSPFSQRQHAFLYALCGQMASLLRVKAPPVDISLEDLRNLCDALSPSLAQHAKQTGDTFYFVIDGVDQVLEGPEGERIIDLLPLQTAPRSPYLLFSCRQDHIHRLPERAACTRVEMDELSRTESIAYLGDAGFSQSELEMVIRRYGGAPGYLGIIKKMKRASPTLEIASIAAELEPLARHQCDLVLTAADPSVLEAISIVATSPAPLPLSIVASLVGIDVLNS